MIYIGLLTHQQKQAGYFIMQDGVKDPDFVYLFHRRQGIPWCIAIWLYESVRIKEVRDVAQAHMDGRLKVLLEKGGHVQIVKRYNAVALSGKS